MAVGAFEKKRLEELFKYFQAASHAIGLADNDVDSDLQYDPTLGRVSLDPVLNALCQLGVHRMNCDRAFISLIDHENQYIISEMTKSTSLYDTLRHNAGDGICMGARPLDLFSGVCAGTLPAFTGGPAPNSHHVNTPNMFADETRYIINDFSLEAHYKDRPYVKGHPHMRYYVEVPIKTSQGYVIGTYAVVDNKPRRGLDEQDFLVLGDISASIMRHIEMVKMQDDYAQSSRLLQGLDSLVQDGHRRTSLHSSDAINNLMTRNPALPSGEDFVSQVSVASEDNIKDPGLPLEPPPTEVLPSDSRPTSIESAQANAKGPTKSDNSNRKSSLAAPAIGHASGAIEHPNSIDSDPVPDFETRSTSANAFNNFDMAAELLRVAMDLDSVLFLDASLSQTASYRHGKLTSSSNARESSFIVQDELSGSELQSCDDPSMSSALRGTTEIPHQAVTVSAAQRAGAKPLGTSTRMLPNNTEATGEPSFRELPQTLHQKLLIRYPHGCIFNLGLKQLYEVTSTLHQNSNFVDKSFLFGHQSIFHQEVLDDILLNFPHANSLIFLPLWSAARSDWFASCFGWSSHKKRIFQPDDLTYFNIFGNSLMARAARLDLIATDHAKSDFISNISHELRSPLHGILGSMELLRELVQDADQQQMIAMVEQCGRTLLDTMNHVLEYSKINSITQNNESHRIVENLRPGTEPKSFMKNISTFDLSSLIEEVVESLVAGHHHGSGSQTQVYSLNTEENLSVNLMRERPHLKQSPLVILDVDYQATWLIESDAASWRRCILNLLGNALKYTDAGFVEVVVRSEGRGVKKAGTVTLLLRDTGRGIGKTYLENHLFRPFVQEDPLSSGVGLGLNIVKSLVHAMGGWLEVQSEVGVGTEVELSIPVSFVSMPDKPDQILLLQQPEFTAQFAGFETCTSNENNGYSSTLQRRTIALKRAVSAHLGDWLKISISSSTNANQSRTDIIVVEEENLALFKSDNPGKSPVFQIPTDSVLLVLCTQHKIQHHSLHLNPAPVYFLSQPFGPRRLASLISRLVLSRNKRKSTEPNGTHLYHEQSSPRTMSSNPSLPQETDEPTPITRTSVADSARQPPSTHMPHVLLVDDNDVNLALLVRCMQQQKISYGTASNGADAFEVYKIADPPFDCVFMDISMPVMDGFAATRAIRDFERSSGRPTTQIIAMTGLGNTEAREEGLLSGMDAYLVKPVQLKKVRSIIQEMSRTLSVVA